MNKVCYIRIQDLEKGLARINFEYGANLGYTPKKRIAVQRQSDQATDAERLLKVVREHMKEKGMTFYERSKIDLRIEFEKVQATTSYGLSSTSVTISKYFIIN